MPHAAHSAIPDGFNPELYALGKEAIAEPTPDERLALAGLAAQAEAAKAERIAAVFGNLAATPEGQHLLAAYETAHAASSQLFGLLSERMVPAPEDQRLTEQLEGLVPLYTAMERRGLAPQVVMHPEHESLNLWQDLGARLEASQLNPNEPNPGHNPNDPSTGGPTRKVIRNGGLWTADEIRDNWATLTNPNSEAPAWTLTVLSTKERPEIVNVTSYGYTDQNNTVASPELNKLLSSLSLPTVSDRSGRKNRNVPLIQPDIHPSSEAYLTAQLTRIIQNLPPLDPNTWSWLKGELPGGRLPAGDWNPGAGRVFLDWFVAGIHDGGLGVRPSGRGRS